MDQAHLDATERAAQLIEKYGLSLVLLLILLLVLGYIGRMLLRGDLVPRELLEKAEEDRDKLQAILDKEREGVMGPLLDVVKNLKKDEDKGG
ncbi:hypothetical protein HGI30_15180 [Paenibacillus albicereus]|uniref:Uncharacterized protein n=1 Tax=Paenibacillus albicereus TaxID=2726185 RepID=A0A6H2GZE4_9BACL|nr:hypothetical protein [Paenibacillus albicereus]QJC52775.1 hypothetical protein HGI30_15180 [Paenibacillus albicereus]